MKISFVTSNNAKAEIAQRALKNFGIEVEQVSVDLIESRAEDPADIAKEKAEQAFKLLGKPCMVEDSGFFIEALGGFPMTHIKYSLKTLGVQNILKMLDGVSNRNCEWRSTVAYAFSPTDCRTFTFIEKGVIAEALRDQKRDRMMSDYWRIYVPKVIPSNNLALCEMNDAEMKALEDTLAAHNQFMMLGEWLSKQHTA